VKGGRVKILKNIGAAPKQ